MPVSYTHHGTHGPNGADPLPLDATAAPTDNTLLNATTSAHGLTPKGTNTGVQFMRDDITYAPPATGGSSHIYQFEHFLQYQPSTPQGPYGNWLAIHNSGATGALSLVVAGTQFLGHAGICQLAPGTVTSQYARLYGAYVFLSDATSITLRCVCYANSAAAKTCQSYFGLNDNAGPAIVASSDYIVFYSIPAVTATWHAYCRIANGSATDIDTGISSFQVWSDLKIVATTTQAQFYVNGTLQTTITTNVPSVGMVPVVSQASSSDTTNQSFYIDSVEMDIDTGTAGQVMKITV